MIYKKIYACSIFFTAIVSYGVWYLVNLLKDIPGINANFQIIINFVIGAFFSFGFFTGMVSILGWLIVKNKRIKRCFLDSTYIEGVWIGFGGSKDGKIVFIVLQIEQTLYGVSVHGQTLKYNDGNPIFRGSWSSIGASFDNDKHSLDLIYISNKMDDLNEGFSSNLFINRGKKSPDVFFGFNTNFSTPEKRVFMGKKFYDLEDMPDLKTISNDAKTFYEEQKEFFRCAGVTGTQIL
jgi:uncharacterized membrane protein